MYSDNVADRWDNCRHGVFKFCTEYWIQSWGFVFTSFQRTGTRRRYHDDGISDEEIDGRRMFDLEEKVSSERFGSDRVALMEGKGTETEQKYPYW